MSLLSSLKSKLKKGLSNLKGNLGVIGDSIKRSVTGTQSASVYTPPSSTPKTTPKIDTSKLNTTIATPKLNIPSTSSFVGGQTTPNVSTKVSKGSSGSGLNAPALKAKSNAAVFGSDATSTMTGGVIGTYKNPNGTVATIYDNGFVSTSPGPTVVGTTTSPSGAKMNIYSDGTKAPASATVLSKAEAPSNISQMNTTVTSPTVAAVGTGVGNVGDASASVTGLQAQIDARMQANADALQAKKDAAALQAQQEKEQKSMFDWMKDQPSQSEQRQDAFKDIGVDPEQYFADQRAGIAEVNALTENYNATLAQRDLQIAQTQDKLASMNFINNQTAQINRNAAPVLNQMSANINAKAAMLQALQGNFAEAEKFVNQAVDDSVADYKAKVDNFKLFYQINDDAISKLDKKYSDALSQATAVAEFDYNKAYTEKKEVADLMVNNPKAGISITDDLITAAQKVVRAGGSIQYKTAMDNINNTGQNNTGEVDTYANSYLNGEIEITNVPEKIRGQVLSKANTIAQQALNNQTTEITPETTATTGGFWSNLFGQ
jgi:hypothetical protein